MASIIQAIIHLPLRIYYTLFWGLEIRGQENLNGLARPLLVIANHKSLHDPWLIGSSLPFFTPLLPVWYLAGSRFYEPMQTLYNIGVIPFVYWFFGITAIPKEGDFEMKIRPALNALAKNKKVVVIFPEGKRVPEDVVGDFRRGAAEIAIRTKVPVLPVVRREVLGKNGKKKTIVYFGKPMYYQTSTPDLLNIIKKTIDAMYEEARQ